MVLLFDGNADGFGPVGVAFEAIFPCYCIAVSIFLFKLACYAVVVGADGVETVRAAVSAHVA